MERYIDGNALYQKLETYKDNVLREFGPGKDVDCFNFFLEGIEAQPTADVAPVVHAHWIRDLARETKSKSFYFCSRCKRYTFVYKKLNVIISSPYCHCGAKMDEEG